MMSSDEDAGPDDKPRSGGVGCNKKRPRQRVDAGEPRNSYSSVAGGQQYATAVACRPNGYIMSPGSKLLSDLLARQKDCDDVLNGYKAATNGYFSDAELYAAQEMLTGQMLFRGGGGKFPDEELSVSGGHASETTPGSAATVAAAAASSAAEKESDSDPGRMSSAGSRSSTPGPALPQDVVKRARVETIVSNMMQGPSRSPAPAVTCATAAVLTAPPVNGCKKRKLYQPQQHEARLLEDDDTDTEEVDEEEDEDEEDHLPGKRRRVDRRSLKSQLSQMQEQLAVLQQRYLELCEAQTTPPAPALPEAEEDGREECGSPDPEDRGLSPDSSKGPLPSRRSCIVKPGPVSLSDDLDWLVESLKSELSSTLGQVIDVIVSRYAQRKANKDAPVCSAGPPKEFHLLSQMLDRKSPRTKVIDRGGAARLTNGHHVNGPSAPPPPPPPQQRTSPFPDVKLFPSPSLKSLQPYCGSPGLQLQPYPPPQPPLSTTPELPEQTEAMSLVVAPKKKRHKVTDTRITPRTVSRLLAQDMDPKYASLLSLPVHEAQYALHHHHTHGHHLHQIQQQHLPGGPPPPLVPVSLPTSVAIPNPSLHQSDVFSSFPFERLAAAAAAGHFGNGRDSPDDDSFMHGGSPSLNSSAASMLGGGGHGSPTDHYGSLHTTPNSHHQHMKQEMLGGDVSDTGDSQGYDPGLAMHTSTLTPMHLRKAKLMFFYVRYPSSAILKMYFPDIKFNKNNTAQLVKWFSNFREFYYIQMEKYARQSLGEGTKSLEDLKVGADSELLRILNLHYNRNNHIEVPEHFRYVVEQTLREFFKAIAAGKDQEQSWKKTIYKVIARLDDGVPEYFKSPNFLEQLE